MKMPFGKYKGEEVDSIPEEYLQWLWEEVDLRGQLKRSVRHVLRAYTIHRDEPADEPCDKCLEVVNVGPDKIKRVYREMAMRWHPDRGGTVQAMQAINEFHERLSA